MSFCSETWDTAKALLKQSGDIEENPGPVLSNECTAAVKIITFNARGLKDKLKLKRLLNKCYNVLKENLDSFVLIQETHLNKEECSQLELLWRQSFCASPGIGRQGGPLSYIITRGN